MVLGNRQYSDKPKISEYCRVPHLGINQPSGFSIVPKHLELFVIYGKTLSGLTNFHGSTGDVILLGTTTNELQPTLMISLMPV